MSKLFTIFADNKEIYKGPLLKMPQYLRNNFIEAINDWGELLSKGGLNELVYSSLHWYNEKDFYCDKCALTFEEEGVCENCNSNLEFKFVHERDPKIDRILDCIGMINRVEISDEENI